MISFHFLYSISSCARCHVLSMTSCHTARWIFRSTTLFGVRNDDLYFFASPLQPLHQILPPFLPRCPCLLMNPILLSNISGPFHWQLEPFDKVHIHAHNTRQQVAQVRGFSFRHSSHEFDRIVAGDLGGNAVDGVALPWREIQRKVMEFVQGAEFECVDGERQAARFVVDLAAGMQQV